MTDPDTAPPSNAPQAPMMAAIFKRDLDETRGTLERWFATKLDGHDEIRVHNLTTTGGLSHEILLFDLTSSQGGREEHRRLVIRIDPVTYRKRLGSNLHREFQALRVLRDQSVLVPQVFWHEDDPSHLGASFYVMERVNGRVAIDQPPYQREGWLADMSEPRRRDVWENAMATMASVHLTPTRNLQFLRRDPSEPDNLRAHMRFWQEHFDWASEGDPDPLAVRAWAWLEANFPKGYPEGLSWGDARFANLMFQEERCVAILDWEDIALASPLLDLGKWFLTDAVHEQAGLPRLAGLGDRAAVIAKWEELTGYSAAHIRWFEIFNATCALSILRQMGRLNAKHAVDHVGPRSNNSGSMGAIITRWLDGA